MSIWLWFFSILLLLIHIGVFFPAMNERALPVLADYTLTHPLAEGGMAEVYEAIQHSLGRTVAVKIMKLGESDLKQRFQREARLVAAINHRHIVTIYDVGELDDGRLYLSMELLAGDLRSRLGKPLSDVEAWKIIHQVAEGLAAVHQQGIVHRDIKPANILFRADGSAVLSDFGIARGQQVDVELTHDGVVVGSPAYSSPEQVTAKALDARSDLYSMGVVLSELLLGYNPYRTGDYTTTVMNQLQMSAPHLPLTRACWQPVLDRLLAKAPEQRFGSAEELLKALDELHFQSGEEEETLVNQIPLRLTQHFKRRQWLVIFTLIPVFIGLVFAWHQYQKHQQIQSWLTTADLRVRQDKLVLPPDDSALFYYQQILQLEGGNDQGRQGVANIVAIEQRRANEARDKGEWDAALHYVGEGLIAAPADAGLLALQGRILAAKEEEHRKEEEKVSHMTDTRHSQKQQGGFRGLMHRLFGH